MKAGDFGSAMDMTKKQVKDGAQVIEINVDNGIIDCLAAMQKFFENCHD